MRILLVADLHYSLQQFDWLLGVAEEFDLVIVAGDLLDLAGHADLDTQMLVVTKYVHRLREKAPLLVCSGNHDGDVKTDDGEFIAQWLLNTRGENLWVDNQTAIFGDVTATVCPWWDGPVTQEAMIALLENEAGKRGKRWIWIHHAPPNDAPICWTGKKFAGDSGLNQLIGRLHPDFVVSGHIHNSPFHEEGSWIARVGEAWAFNPGCMFGPQPPHIVLDLDTMKAKWISAYGEKEADLAVLKS